MTQRWKNVYIMFKYQQALCSVRLYLFFFWCYCKVKLFLYITNCTSAWKLGILEKNLDTKFYIDNEQLETSLSKY